MTTSPPGNRVLHVANGTATTRLIAAAGIPGVRSLWADPLYEGPVPGGITDDALVTIRTTFLAAGMPAAAADPVNDLRAWRSVIARQAEYDELILWFEHDLFDQLNLVQALTWIAALPVTRPVSLICIGSFPGRSSFKGLGELTPSEIATLPDLRQPVTADQFDLARRLWSAFREPRPDALDGVRRGDTGALPFVGAAISRLLQELPWTGDGLSRSERRLLQLAASGSTLVRDALSDLHEGEQAYYVTDVSAALMARQLATTSPPLLASHHDAATDGADGDTGERVSVTALGHEVLAGRANRITACGIDRWLGGVHLQPGHVWRWNHRLERVEADPNGH